jgi:hypothetical protein
LIATSSAEISSGSRIRNSTAAEPVCRLVGQRKGQTGGRRRTCV